MSFKRLVYPFSAIVGQNELKLALLLIAINPRIGGLLIRGQKGTGKSTSVRALIDVLPEINVVKGCLFNCNPSDPTNMCPLCFEKCNESNSLETERKRMSVVSLPIGATEDRVIGSLDIEKAIGQGIRALQPGLLAAANQNILYIDEVNLLPDHIIDSILDVAPSGWNIIEREGISIQHPSRFILVGTMNPEEGELRPQLADRFSLHISVEGIYDEESRIEIVERNLAFGEDPLGFLEKWEGEQDKMRRRILEGRKLLNSIKVSKSIIRAVVSSSIKLHVDGHRPDISIIRAAKSLVAFEGREEVTAEEVLRVANMAIGFRTRGGGFEVPATLEQVREVFMDSLKSV
jgi:Mg-chelatase subunit ChlI